MSGCSAIYILDLKGKILISRDYRGDVGKGAARRFITMLTDDMEAEMKPVVQEEGVSYVYIRHNNLYLMATMNGNANAAMVILFLYRVVNVFQEYFHEMEEESIRDNFVIVYELLDEMMDYGFPQSTDSKILKEYITQESHKLDLTALKPPPALTQAVSWRKEGIRYKKNEVFLDVVEKVNLLINANGVPVRSEIVGAIKMRSQLSGMPELRLGLNDRVQFEATGRAGQRGRSIEMEDVNFHQCVRLSRFESDRTISFIPPDGAFELMSYRLNTQVKPLIWVEAVIDKHSHSRIEYNIKARSQFKQRSVANKVEVWIPVPKDANTPKFRTSIGTVKYRPEKDAMVWSIKQFPGAKEFMMNAQFGLPSVTDEEEVEKRPPISVNFEIPYFTVSGIQVRYLKIIERSGYKSLPWVRYLSAAGDYQIRID
mmetsp:Transcript_10577/g.26666  ORF Transcript_10577/g.26666 Transcript_10577/m.26666 type:complete len:427 (+) Transcript_10577:187-1467(+)|eukprot:CAMPEP_0177671880 /NCGR_PEP_ID=MMETSP0447-20121125/24991_1 /TAXON_ID=0 /ORGANISM="Stygamoeba regulata, Strain BSH-02190019" /LENGTH=426 /DNA_ID=CAMNT_0019179405 /DNA_START=176 /DNA_END=1456 /DNA_ORIENTATION=+